MTHRCVIISGGNYAPVEGVQAEDFVIACDKGYVYAEKAGIRPNLLVGDFDSYEGVLPSDLPVWRYKKEKDDTDTMIAIRYAVEQGFAQVELLGRQAPAGGADGGRGAGGGLCRGQRGLSGDHSRQRDHALLFDRGQHHPASAGGVVPVGVCSVRYL